MSSSFVRLRLHEPNPSLLLIHEVDQPSYLLIEEIVVLDITYCLVSTSGALVSGSVGASQEIQLAGATCGLICNERVRSSPALNLAAGASSSINGTVSGGHC